MKGAKEIRVDYPQEIAHRVGRLNPVPAQHTYWQQDMPSLAKTSHLFSIIPRYPYIPLLFQASTSAALQDTRMPVVYKTAESHHLDPIVRSVFRSDKYARSKRGCSYFGPVTCRVLVASSDFSTMLYVLCFKLQNCIVGSCMLADDPR